MKTRLTIILMTISLVLGLGIQVSAQEAGWDLAKSAGGRNSDQGLALHRHSASVIFAGGTYSGQTQFGNITVPGSGAQDGIVLRYTQNGDVVWANRIASTGNDKVLSVTSDANGNVYATGYFESEAGISGTFVESKGGKDLFIAKYSQAGLLLWVRTIGSIGDDMGNGVSCDATGNVFLTGTYSDSLRLILNTNDTVKIGTAGGKDIIMVKYNENGALLTYSRGGGPQDDIASDVQVHSSGIAFTGTFSGKIGFKNDSIISNGSTDIVLVNYSSNAFEPIWIKGIGGATADIADDVTTDGTGNILVAGSATGTLTIGTSTLTSQGGSDGLLAKFAPNGNVEWAQLVGSTGDDNCSGISADINGNVLITGRFSGNATFGTTSLVSTGGNDIYVARFNPAGTVAWAQSAGSTSDESSDAIAHNGAGGAYIVGSHGFQARFSKTLLTGKGESDFYFARILTVGANDAGVIAINTPAVPFANGKRYITATVKNFGSSIINSLNLEVFIAGNKIGNTISYATPINPGSTAIIAVDSINFAPAVLTPLMITTIRPNNIQDENTGNDSETRLIGPALAKGTYTIGGTNAAFSSVAHASSYISNWGILDSVTFLVRSGSYSDNQVVLSEIPGSSNTKPVQFKKDPAASSTPQIAFESLYPERNYVMLLDGADNVRFDNLGVSVLSNSTYGNAIVMRNNTASIAFNAMTVDIPTSANGNGISIESNNASSKFSVMNSVFTGGNYSIHSTYDTASTTPVNIEISHNTLSQFKTGGLHIPNTQVVNITHNALMPANTAQAGIVLLKNTESGYISNNSINGLKQGTAITLHNVKGTTNTRSLISNNMLLIGSPTTSAHGINLVNSEYVQVYHNTIHGLNGTYDGVLLGSIGGNYHDFINNLLYNSGRGTAISIAYNATVSIPTIYSNNNALFTDSGRIGTINDGSTITHSSTLSNWKTNSLKDANSVSKSLVFSQDNLHLNFADEQLYGDASINGANATDFDNEPRKNSYMGADEIIPVITILTQPIRTIVCDTSPALLFVKADATFNGTLSYQWTKNNTLIPGATNDTLSFTKASYLDEGFYRCIVKANSGADSVLTDRAQLLISTETIILNDLQNQYTVNGGTAIFDVGAEAGNMPPTHPVKYRWFRDTVEFTNNTDFITGVNTPRLILKNVQPADTGMRYRVIVEGACGIDTSSTVGIFMPGVLFTKQPTDTASCKNSKIALIAEVTPSMAGLQLAYQWKKNFVNINDNSRIQGANSPILIIDSLSASDTSSSYALEVLVIANNARFFSNIIKVQMYVSTEITKQPVTEQACLNKPYTMSVEAQGSNLTYQWQRNDTNIIGAINSEYTIPIMTDSLIGRYRVVVSGICGTSVSSIANIRTFPPLTVLSQSSKNTVANLTKDLSLNVYVAGVDPISYQWYHKGVKDDANTQANFVRRNVTSADTGAYWCVISDRCDTIVSDTIRVRLVPVSVDESEPIRVKGQLFAGTINPNPATDIVYASFTMDAASMVTIQIRDIMGRNVGQSYSSALDAGEYSIPLNVEELPSGTYICTISAHGSSYSKRMIIRR